MIVGFQGISKRQIEERTLIHLVISVGIRTVLNSCKRAEKRSWKKRGRERLVRGLIGVEIENGRIRIREMEV